jgi:hypothetical protein
MVSKYLCKPNYTRDTLMTNPNDKMLVQSASKIRSRWGAPQIIPPSFTICGTRTVVNSSDEMHKNSPAEPKKNSKLYTTNQMRWRDLSWLWEAWLTAFVYKEEELHNQGVPSFFLPSSVDMTIQLNSECNRALIHIHIATHLEFCDLRC